MGVNSKSINSLIFLFEYFLKIIALCAVSLVINGFAPVNADFNHSNLHEISFNTELTLIVALGLLR